MIINKIVIKISLWYLVIIKGPSFITTVFFDGSMVAYPIKYVIDNSIKFATLKTKFITVISLNNGGVDINTVSLHDVENVAKRYFLILAI